MTFEQFEKIDPCYFDIKMEDECEEKKIKARQLLCSNRFDLYAILLYVDHRVKGVADMSYATLVYKERTRALTGFSFVEKEKEKEKNKFEDYIESLDKLIKDYQNGSFDEGRTLVPVDKDYVLIDGAHRVAVAAYFDGDVNVVRFINRDAPKVTSTLLKSLLMPDYIADAMALESVKWHNDLFMLFLWPKAFLYPDILKSALTVIRSDTDVFYEKETKFSYSAIRILMMQIYSHMDWIGNVDNDFASIYAKADEVWDKNGMCKLILVRAKSCEYILRLKARIRDLFKIKLASMHSTDNIKETCIAVNAVFNKNYMFFLNHGQPTKYKRTYKLFEKFKSTLIERNCDLNDFILDTSVVLAMFGMRNANDLDYYSLKNGKNLFSKEDNIEMHDDTQRRFYDVPIDDLISNPQNFFVFNEIKFVALNKLLSFKGKRYSLLHDLKDAMDIKAIK